jgi:hypothetical protein
VENFAPTYFQWGRRDVGDNAGIVNNNRCSKRSFGQEASSEAECSIRFVDVAKLQSERHIRSNAQIYGWMARSSFIFPCPWGAGLGMEKNISDLTWFWMGQ